MASLNDRVLAFLIDQGLLTAEQERRVRAALAQGLSLEDAIAKTPIVIASDLSTALEMEAEAEPETPPDPPAPEPKVEATPVPATPDPPVSSGGASDEHELDPDLILEFDDPDDKPIPTPIPAGATAPMASAPSLDDELDLGEDFIMPDESPAASGEHELDDELTFEYDEPPAPPPAAVARPKFAGVDTALGGIFDEAFGDDDESTHPPFDMAPQVPAPAAGPPQLKSMGPEAQYERKGKQVPSYDLGSDDGVTLIQEVNALLSEAFDAEDRGIVLDSRKDIGNVFHYDKRSDQKKVDTYTAEKFGKVANRLKSMAKLDSNKLSSGPQRGSMKLMHDGLPRRAFVEALLEGGKEVVTVYLFKN